MARGGFYLVTYLLYSMWTVQEAESIGCYVCESVNNSLPACEDEFQATPDLYNDNCLAAKKSSKATTNNESPTMRNGLFPASHCIKFKAVNEATNETYMVRNCALDSGSTTVDTEIGLISHCGWVRNIKYNEKEMTGCVMSCDSDGCNDASHTHAKTALVMASLTATAAILSYVTRCAPGTRALTNS